MHQWRETKNRELRSQIAVVVRELERAVDEIARLVAGGEQQAELERQRWAAAQEQRKREEAEHRAAKTLKESKEELLQIVEAWAESRRLEEFFSDAQRRAVELPDEQRLRIVERLQRARDLIGRADALERFNAWKSPDER